MHIAPVPLMIYVTSSVFTASIHQGSPINRQPTNSNVGCADQEWIALRQRRQQILDVRFLAHSCLFTRRGRNTIACPRRSLLDPDKLRNEPVGAFLHADIAFSCLPAGDA